ncbi:MAG: helix-turn-helix domain-containing protein [Kiritimatiellia bacterium]
MARFSKLAEQIDRINANIRMPLPKLAIPHDVYAFTRSPHQLPWRGRNYLTLVHFNLVYNIQGSGQAIISDVRHKFPPGTALLVFPGQPRRYEVDVPQKFRWFFIGFMLDRVDELQALRDRILVIDNVSQQLIVDVLQAYITARSGRLDSLERSVRLSLTLWLLLARIASRCSPRIHRQSGAADMGDLIGRVQALVMAQPSKPLSISQIAQKLGISTASFNRRFQHVAGTSPGQYMRTLRLCRGRDLLNTTQLSVKEVADACGFSSPFAFSRAFSKLLGMSPRQYRRKHGK